MYSWYILIFIQLLDRKGYLVKQIVGLEYGNYRHVRACAAAM